MSEVRGVHVCHPHHPLLLLASRSFLSSLHAFFLVPSHNGTHFRCVRFCILGLATAKADVSPFSAQNASVPQNPSKPWRQKWGLDKQCPRNIDRVGVLVPIEHFQPPVNSILKLISNSATPGLGPRGKKRNHTCWKA